MNPLLQALQNLRRLSEKKLSDIAKKGEWIKLTPKLLADKELLGELFDLIRIAYNPIGGHLTIRKPVDIPNNAAYVLAVDIDADPEADAVVLGRTLRGRLKITATGHDASSEAKAEAMREWLSMIIDGKAFAEVSGAVAHIALKHGVPSVGSQKEVEAVLGTPVEWVGMDPEKRYPLNPHWYKRKIGGEDHLKILVGRV
jgi:hypothetical protein